MIVSGTELTSNAILQWADDHRSPGTASQRASRVQNTFGELRAIPRCSFTEVALDFVQARLLPNEVAVRRIGIPGSSVGAPERVD
jgi:hypothetical protein